MKIYICIDILKMIIFYSWQNEYPWCEQESDLDFIEDILTKICEENGYTLFKSNTELIKDINITTDLLFKIKNCDVFIGDINGEFKSCIKSDSGTGENILIIMYHMN